MTLPGCTAVNADGLLLVSIMLCSNRDVSDIFHVVLFILSWGSAANRLILAF